LQKIGKPNNIKDLGSKDLNRIANIDYGYICLREISFKNNYIILGTAN
jgi:hypothetical protein